MSQLQMFVSMKAAAAGGLTPGAAYSETWSLTAATLFGNAVYQGMNGPTGTLTDKNFGGLQADINAAYTTDTTNDQFSLSSDSSLWGRYGFASITLNGATYTPETVATWTPYFDDGEGGITYPSWGWTNGTNGATVAKLTNGQSYNFVITAYVLDGSSTITIGTTGITPNRFWGYLSGSIGSIASVVGSTFIYQITYGESANKTTISLAETSPSTEYKYVGPTIKVRYNGVDTTLTQTMQRGIYQVTGDPFSLSGNTGSTRALQYVSVGA